MEDGSGSSLCGRRRNDVDLGIKASYDIGWVYVATKIKRCVCSPLGSERTFQKTSSIVM